MKILVLESFRLYGILLKRKFFIKLKFMRKFMWFQINNQLSYFTHRNIINSILGDTHVH